MNNPASRHVLSIHVPPPRRRPRPPPAIATPRPPKTTPNPYDTATHLGATLCEAKGRRISTIGMARGAGGRDGRGKVGGWGRCDTAVGTTTVGWPTAGSCTTRSSMLIYSTSCHETCLDKCEISGELFEMFANT